ncbi:DEKNAAC101065 [Brettanomyces naardenensis]|uniref:Ammonium transporter n=1 Tax=Brettanomyces naardenensis TaxID=13370 RepID=A0A448YGZ0_BRENA|nr:DEKNAAC101065 [Brettanomyces naardenensis]
MSENQNDQPAMVWLGTSGALVLIMTPGIGLLYSGLSRKKHALSLLWASMMAICVVSFQWFFWGYSLTFGPAHGHGFLGDLTYFSLKDILVGTDDVAMPQVVFCFFQCMFAVITGAIMLGGACERARLGPMMLFLFLWITVVYCPCAMWTWNPEGWLATLGVYDFAGGGPVHQSSGWGALAYALMCGKRRDPVARKGLPKYKPHSVTSVVLGTVFLWFGWFGFNGGSSGNASLRGFYACLNTNLAASCGGLAWMFLDWFRCGHKWTTVGLCSGAVAGLVGITPAAGFVPIYFAVPIGVLTAIATNYAVDLKNLLQIDDGLDAWALHGVGGFVGSALTGLFAADYIVATDPGAAVAAGGWLNHHWVQLGYQLAANVSIDAWAFVVTSILLFVMNHIPFLKIRLSEEEEDLGTDAAQIGEFTYQESNMFIPEPIRSVTSKKQKHMNSDLEAANVVPLPKTDESTEEKSSN